MIASILTDGSLGRPQLFSKEKEYNSHQSTPYFSKKLNKLFYSLSNIDDNGKLNYDEGGKNTLAIGITNNLNEPKRKTEYRLRDFSSSFYYPFYDDKTDRLYFAANLHDSHGGTDLYYVITNNGKIMSAPVNLGPRINTPGNEISPYIFDGYLYFASDIFYGLGGMDIYKSELLDDENFSVPANLGYGINSAKDDFGLILREIQNEKLLLGYFSSNREEGRGSDDLYGVITKANPGERFIDFKGNVVNALTNSGVGNAKIKIMNNQKVIFEDTTNDYGAFDFNIPLREAITVEVSKSKHNRIVLNYDTDNLLALDQQVFIEMTNLEDVVEIREKQVMFKTQ